MRQTDEAVPLRVLEMAILMVNAADQCDQAGQWDRDHRRACRHILDWYNSNDYKITCDKAGCGARQAGHGRMIEGKYPNENKCSECGQEFRDDIGFIIQDDDGVFHYPKRCPECGCYWDGGADNG